LKSKCKNIAAHREFAGNSGVSRQHLRGVRRSSSSCLSSARADIFCHLVLKLKSRRATVPISPVNARVKEVCLAKLCYLTFELRPNSPEGRRCRYQDTILAPVLFRFYNIFDLRLIKGLHGLCSNACESSHFSGATAMHAMLTELTKPLVL